MVTLFALFINSKTEIEIFIIAAKTTILFHTGMNYSCKRGYIIPDRNDLHCEVPVVPFKDLSQMKPGEPSLAIRERVIKARQMQTERFSHLPRSGGHGGPVYCNAQMTERMIHQFAEPDAASLDMLRMAMEKLKLSARAYSRILKVARTIADLAGSEKVQAMHIAEAIGYRNLDRGDWAERGI